MHKNINEECNLKLRLTMHAQLHIVSTSEAE